MTKANSIQGMSWEEIGFLLEGMSFASRPLGEATARITDQYSLGPRGAWIITLIARGDIYPLDVARLFKCGRSLVTAELGRLSEAGLIEMQQIQEDRRKTKLILTPKGEHVHEEIRAELKQLAVDRLQGFTRAELDVCAKVLRAMRAGSGALG